MATERRRNIDSRFGSESRYIITTSHSSKTTFRWLCAVCVCVCARLFQPPSHVAELSRQRITSGCLKLININVNSLTSKQWMAKKTAEAVDFFFFGFRTQSTRFGYRSIANTIRNNHHWRNSIVRNHNQTTCTLPSNQILPISTSSICLPESRMWWAKSQSFFSMSLLLPSKTRFVIAFHRI